MQNDRKNERRSNRNTYQPPKQCIFCKDREVVLDYKEITVLGKFLNRWNKIESRNRNGNCTKHQRLLTTAIKRARHLALLPFTVR